MNILVVDDSNSARYVAVKTLRDIGYKNVTASESGEDALLRVNKEKFDCILLDWNMSGMSGLDFLKQLRADPAHDKTAVIMVTTVNEKSNVMLALKVGIQGYFFKPINAATLGPKLKELEAKLNPASQKPVVPVPATPAAASPQPEAKASESPASNDSAPSTPQAAA
jgi:two-component system, chemotaxis family, chemotaxis protein CheY